MPADDVQIKCIPGIRVAELTATAASFEPESISTVIQPLYDELRHRLGRAGLTPSGPYIECGENSDTWVTELQEPIVMHKTEAKMMHETPLFHSVTDAAQAVRRKELSSRELTEMLLTRIEAVSPALNAVVELRREAALREARLPAAKQRESSVGNWGDRRLAHCGGRPHRRVRALEPELKAIQRDLAATFADGSEV